MCGKEQEMNKPTFVNQPYDIEAHEGTTIELPCQGESNDEFEVIYSIETVFKKNTQFSMKENVFLRCNGKKMEKQ